MGWKRRQILLFLGATTSSLALGKASKQAKAQINSPINNQINAQTYGMIPQDIGSADPRLASQPQFFQPIQGPMPYRALPVSAQEQPQAFASYRVQDDLLLPEGFTYEVIATWGDAVGNGHFGYNNDYLSFIPVGPEEGYLTVNFEYISTETWEQTYSEVRGESLPFEAVKPELEKAVEKSIDAFGLAEGDPLKAQIQAIAQAALTDQGVGVLFVRRSENGGWHRVAHPAERRISGLSGWADGRYLKATGPATAIFEKSSVQGYGDGLGSRIIGTFGNCAGGTTPWGTLLSAEENFQSQVPEAVYRDGSAFPPAAKGFDIGFDGQGNVFGLAGNKYGWIVEVDPSNPDDYGTKHTWLGRYRHEAVGIRVSAGKPLAFYSGCDRRGGHLYKFISSGVVGDPLAKANSQLLSDGMLYAAKFNPDGSGQWIALQPSTPVAPVLPSGVVGGKVMLPKRPEGGFEAIEEDAIAQAFAQTFATLGDLYEGSEQDKQGAILIDAHFAANAAGATPTARPEDTVVAADGALFIAFTSGSAGAEGGPDKAIFVGPRGETNYEAGWIMKLTETADEPGAMTFRWEMMATGGEPAEGGLGFANPDNLAFDPQGNLWVVTDMSTGAHNKAVPSRQNEQGQTLRGTELLGLYGNNSLWQIPLAGDEAGRAKLFACGPMECELTGPAFTADAATLFLSVQHPGEVNGKRRAMAAEIREFALKTTAGEVFVQKREVPIGSNWPQKTENAAPKPAIVAIRRSDQRSIV